MKSVMQTVLVGGLAMLAFSAVATASASAALPEFVLGEGGRFPTAIEGNNTGNSFIEGINGSRYIEGCKGASVKGEITGAKSASLAIESQNCEEFGGPKCTSTGAAQGHIVLSGSASLVYINKTTKQVGLVQSLKELKISCGETNFKIQGSVVIPVTPINTQTSKYHLTIRQTKGLQEFTSYENEKGEKVTAHLKLTVPWTEQIGYEVEEQFALTMSEPLTIDG